MFQLNRTTPDLPNDVWAKLEQIVAEFESAHRKGLRPVVDEILLKGADIPREVLLLELVYADLEFRLEAGESVGVEHFLEAYPEIAAHPDKVFQLICWEHNLRVKREPILGLEEYQRRFPQFNEELGWHWQGKTEKNNGVQGDRTIGFPQAHESSEPKDHQKPVSGDTAIPQRIGRYRVERLLGKGGFGRVYLAHDDQLRRLVAIKVPHQKLVARPEDAEPYLAEARIVAALDHPNIVPVFDAGQNEDCPCFVVTKFIEGSTLAQKIGENRPATAASAELVATVAETLHYAHRQGLVHRDIKPGNILLEASGKPYVADFGLALKDDDVGHGPRYAGTPVYMSPEQARGESHRVDGRSDLFSLGTVFYELLTGRRPFHADSQEELVDLITSMEVRPPRQWDETIPKELERICLKALSKRVSERYSTGRDMADDLRHFLEETRGQGVGEIRRQGDTETGRHGSTTPTPVSLSPGLPVSLPTPSPSDSRPIRIVPKGLRSFDAHDADFFLELLPGPRDRDGLPGSIRFWKTLIEETDPDNTFAVGLVYGPSGCGKSSLVKAGLLPRLARDVITVYVEATAQDTETRLLNGLRKHCPALTPQPSFSGEPQATAGLKETLASLRRGQGLPGGKKVLIVLDQFEQWLHAQASHAPKRPESEELVQALRQCNGGRVQAIIMVRDDFWMAVTRFLTQLEIELVQGRNFAAVDLFDLTHARKVLAALGRAFGKLPEKLHKISKEQKEFLNEAIAGLAQEDKVICVRLALFAEMMKGKPWTSASLKEVGGTQGIGVTFLEDTFSSATGNPKHRLHQKAARAVLMALLPESGTDIKGHMRSHAELLAASGYPGPYGPRLANEFDDLVRILDGELRLIAPTDPEGEEDKETRRTGDKENGFYQLTHDYLVPSLRDWLTRKQKETRRGRAELLLADRAAVWNDRAENRQLPSLWQWVQIRSLTREKNWALPERKMMRKATRVHAARGLVAVFLLALLGYGAYEVHGRVQAYSLRARLLDANTNEVPTIVTEMAPYRGWLDPLLQEAYAQAEAGKDSRRQLNTGLGLLPVDSSQVAYLYGRLLDAEPKDMAVLRVALANHKSELTARLWQVALQPETGKKQQRLRAAYALAEFDSEDRRWGEASEPVAKQLVAENPIEVGAWIDGLRPVSTKFIEPLAAIFRDSKEDRQAEKLLAARILADYGADNAALLADLIQDADEKQFAVLFPKLKTNQKPALNVLTKRVSIALAAQKTDAAKEILAKRQANAAVALIRMEQGDEAWPLLKHGPDPRVRSYLIHRLGPMSADARAIVKQLDREPDVTIRRALILSLGEYSSETWGAGEQELIVTKMKELYRQADDPGLHAAAEWLLRQWKQEDWLRATNNAWAQDEEGTKKKLASLASRAALAAGLPPATGWYVNGQSQTMVVICGPVEFTMGSPQKPKRIEWNFALAATPVTQAQFLRFKPEFRHDDMPRYPEPSCPVGVVNWLDAARYCNWLSNQEKVPEEQWCYETTGAAATLKENYLGLTGYRLPTEAEWEYACRAGSTTSRFFGESDELLGKYGWYLWNSQDHAWPVGSKKPNDFGLFDMHGHVWNWCQDIYQNKYLALRGGGFTDQARFVRSDNRILHLPGDRSVIIGFRPARTMP